MAKKPDIKTIHLSEKFIGQRIDGALAKVLTDTPRTKIQELIKKGKVYDSQNHKIIFKTPSQKIRKPIKVIIEITEKKIILPQPDHWLDLNIIFEDKHIIIINKQAGVTVHPGSGRQDKTLVNALLHHTNGTLSNLSGNDRPGIVHRLDKDTTGLMVVTKTNQAHAHIAEQIKTRDMKRTYQAILWGTPSPRKSIIETLIARDPKNRLRMAVVQENGKTSITHYQVIKPLGLNNCLVECNLDTGRTHQIRVHMNHIGFPVVGDQTYGRRQPKELRYVSPESREKISKLNRQALHAHKLQLIHPISGETLSFISDIPNDMSDIAESLNEKD